MKPVFRRASADSDIQNAVDYYLMEADHMVDPFLLALQKAVQHIERHPATGSPKYAHELNIPNLRFWPLTRFPYLLLYIDNEAFVDLIHLTHMGRDIPASLQGDE